MHEKAIYLHGGQQYHVEHLDFKERKAYVKQVDVDYYTDAIRYTQVRVLEIAETERLKLASRLSEEHRQECLCHLRSHGDVLVRSQVVGFKKIKFFTNENIGAGQAGVARERDAHDVLLDHAGAGAAGVSALLRSASGNRACLGCSTRWNRWQLCC